MFINFFYKLKSVEIPVSPTAFLTLQKAFEKGLVRSLKDFYITARTILVKNERYFDLFDQVFSSHFDGTEMPDAEDLILDDFIRTMLDEWLTDPKVLAKTLGFDEKELSHLSPEELIEYFKERLKDQKGRHQGGTKWIGTGGTSPVGHSGTHPGGMRVGGESRNKSAVKVAMDRRYRDYSQSGPLTQSQIGEALKRLRNMVAAGPKDQINIDESIYQTVKNGGEIQITFDRRLKDRLKVVLAIDNGGWSMDPYIQVVQSLFDYSRSQFKELSTCFFHNTVYETVWADSRRRLKPIQIQNLGQADPETRVIFVGDASMAPFELMITEGSIYVEERSRKTSVDCLSFIARNFPHSVWLNPVPKTHWRYTKTIGMIEDIIPMFELTLDGLENAIAHMMKK